MTQPGTYISSWPGLTLQDCTRAPNLTKLPLPLGIADRLSFCVARSGIYHLFRALRFTSDEVVLVPDYHSGNEVAAIRAAGASIAFYPILRSLDPDLDTLSRLIRKLRPRVVYVIHYLGWAQPLEEIEALCRECGAILVEDCALSMLSETSRGPLGAFGDYSIFCLYKTLPVPNGGVLVQNRHPVPELSGLSLDPCPKVAAVGRTLELALETLRSRAARLGGFLAGAKRLAGRALRRGGVRHVPVGDIGWDPANVQLAMSPISEAVMSRLDYASIRTSRRRNFLQLRNRLNGSVKLLRDDLDEGVCPLFFPILVQDKATTARNLLERGIGAVEFWSDKTGVEIGSEARFLRAHVLELPIHQGVTVEQVDYIADQILHLRPKPALC